MASTRPNADGIETLLNRLSAAIDQITKASEKQAREIDKQLKRLVDRGEKSTERLLKTIDKEIKAQITSLRRELHDVERRVTEMRQAGKKQLATKQAAKQGPAKNAAATREDARLDARVIEPFGQDEAVREDADCAGLECRDPPLPLARRHLPVHRRRRDSDRQRDYGCRRH